MLNDHVERYLALRRALGYKLRNTGRNLQAFAHFASDKGDTHIRAATAVEWAAQASSPHARHVRLHDVVLLARFLYADTPRTQPTSCPQLASSTSVWSASHPTSTRLLRSANCWRRPTVCHVPTRSGGPSMRP